MMNLVTRIAVATLAVLGPAIASATIVLSPSTPGVIPGYYGPSNCEPDCIAATFEDGTPLDLLYKADVGSTDSGSYASSYNTVFANTPSDPSDALLTYVGGNEITCPTCYLAIKDGNQTPGYYFYNLAGWDGIEAISLKNFWPQQGAISHISIWGTSRNPPSAPEPATLGLLGMGLLAVGLRRRKA